MSTEPLVDLHLADCREVLASLPDNSIDAVVTDPPYEISFMGHGWDASRIAFDREVWTEALRVLKPGGHVVAYGAARTYHWLACAVELAGFDIRDMVPWLQGQGMPHGLDVSKAIDKMAGTERIPIMMPTVPGNTDNPGRIGRAANGMRDISAPITPEAAQWSGWNTQLAPGHEPCVLARAPLSEANVAANVLRWGTGALNVDGCRIGDTGGTTGRNYAKTGLFGMGGKCDIADIGKGRWPPNVTLSEAAAARLDAMVGKLPRAGNKPSSMRAMGTESQTARALPGYKGGPSVVHGKDPGGPSEFFYTAKAATRERENGCEHLRWTRCPEQGFRPWTEQDGHEALLVDHKGRPIGNPHPTVKPLALMRWLVRLVTPPGGIVLDPFMGSGTTGVAAVCEGMGFVGVDATPWAHTIAEARIRWARGLGPKIDDLPSDGRSVQPSLFG